MYFLMSFLWTDDGKYLKFVLIWVVLTTSNFNVHAKYCKKVQCIDTLLLIGWNFSGLSIYENKHNLSETIPLIPYLWILSN